MPYDFAASKAVLTDTEKDRIVALYLSSNTTAVNAAFDWEKGTAAFGSASVASMKISLANSLKKLTKLADGDDAVPSPAKTPGSGRKRKTKGADEDDVEGTPKKRSGRKKNEDVKAEATGEDDEKATEAVKAESE